jgi:hypothetical protein
MGSKVATRAIRKITAADAVDSELLRLSGILAELQKETRRLADYVEPEDVKVQRRIDALLAKASAERQEQTNAEQN